MNRPNRVALGWASYSRLGRVDPAYATVEMHAKQRLRRRLRGSMRNESGSLGATRTIVYGRTRCPRGPGRGSTALRAKASSRTRANAAARHAVVDKRRGSLVKVETEAPDGDRCEKTEKSSTLG